MKQSAANNSKNTDGYYLFNADELSALIAAGFRVYIKGFMRVVL